MIENTPLQGKKNVSLRLDIKATFNYVLSMGNLQ